MPLSSAEQVRLAISDQLQSHEYFTTGDANRLFYRLPHSNAFVTELTLDVVFDNGSGGLSVSGNVFVSLTTGLAGVRDIFASTDELRFGYRAAAFSPDEIDQFLSVDDTVLSAQIAAVESLMFDGTARASWAMAPGQKYDDTKVLDHLQQMHDKLTRRRMEEVSILAPGPINWALG